jgi:hypothetical protein
MGVFRLVTTELIIKQLKAILKDEAVFEKRVNGKSKISAKRLSQRVEEWGKVSKEYHALKDEIQKMLVNCENSMKKIDIFEKYYEKHGLEA